MTGSVHYFLVFLVAATGALVATPVVIFLAKSFNLVDRPGTRKVHTLAVPRLGGIAVCGTLLFVSAALMVVLRSTTGSLAAIPKELVVLVAASLGMGVVGLLDDILNLRARYKLFTQLILALALCAFGIRVNELVITKTVYLHFGLLAWPISVLWVIGVTNSLNLIDGLDGLAGGIAAIACAVLAFLAFYMGQQALGVLLLILLGSLAGFWVFNRHPASIFLGDSGSLFLGFLLAGASLLITAKTYSLSGLALPAIALGLPILDTFFAITRRLLERRPVFSPDRNHLHHQLLARGFGHRGSVILMCTMTVLASMIGLGTLLTSNIGSTTLFVLAWVPLLAVFKLSGGVKIDEFWSHFQRRQGFASETRRDEERFQQLQLRLREVEDATQWWRVLRRAARFLGFRRISIESCQPKGRPIRLAWSNPRMTSEEQVFRAGFIAYPFGPDKPFRVSMEMAVSDRLESIGRKIALFGRLLDEHHLVSLPSIEPQLKAVETATSALHHDFLGSMGFVDFPQVPAGSFEHQHS